MSRPVEKNSSHLTLEHLHLAAVWQHARQHVEQPGLQCANFGSLLTQQHPTVHRRHLTDDGRLTVDATRMLLDAWDAEDAASHGFQRRVGR